MQRAAQLDQEQLPGDRIKISLTKDKFTIFFAALNIYLRLRTACVQETQEEADSLDAKVRKMELIVHHRSVNL